MANLKFWNYSQTRSDSIMLGLYSKTSHVSILTQKEWEQIEACMASLSDSVAGEKCLFHMFFPYLCRSDVEGLQQLWQNHPLL